MRHDTLDLLAICGTDRLVDGQTVSLSEFYKNKQKEKVLTEADKLYQELVKQ
jgi:hypothetical protein